MEWKLAHPQVTNIKLHVVVVMAVVGMIVAGAHLRKIALKGYLTANGFMIL